MRQSRLKQKTKIRGFEESVNHDKLTSDFIMTTYLIFQQDKQKKQNFLNKDNKKTRQRSHE